MKVLNNKQNIMITENRKDIEGMKEDISDIKVQVFNHLPGIIDAKNRETNKKIDDLKDKILIGVAIVIATQIILKLF